MAHLLEGEVEDPALQRLEAMETELRQARQELRESRAETRQVRASTDAALSALRRQLGPLYRALQAVFGELDVAGVEGGGGESTTSSSTPKVTAVWESWKQKLGSNTAPARVIDALLQHGELNVAQLKVAAKMANQTVYDSIHRLNKLGLINKNGGKFSLKTL